MTISRRDAEEALNLVAATERRSAELRGYQGAAPHVILWGGLWAFGYMAGYFLPRAAGWVWLAIVIGGTACDILIASKFSRENGPALRFFGLLAVFFAFIIGTIIVMAPQNPNQIAAFIPMVVACAYVMIGLFGAPRLLVTGIGVYVLTLAGYFLLPQIFQLWMAAVGGGGLIIGGLWLRTA
jgi:hypothetical protein